MFTQLIHTAAQAAHFAHKPENRGAAFICADCCEALYLPCGGMGATGYARTAGDELICYPCADKRQFADLIGADRAYGYLSRDGRRFTNWTGGTLGAVTESTPTALPFGRSHSWTHGRSYRSVRVRDVHGRIWWGKGSPGVCIALRRIKGA